MRRLSTVSSVLAMSLLAIGGMASATIAQGASPMPTAGSPIVGAWLLDVGNEASPATQAIFNADGTYLATDASGTAVGSWVATGPSTGALTSHEYGVENQGQLYTVTIRGTVEVAADDTLTATFSVEYGGASDAPPGQFGPATATATRIAVEPMASELTPMGATPSTAP